MRTLARILCAIDLEKASERAFDRALSLAVLGNARLFILHATPASLPLVVVDSGMEGGGTPRSY
jgi:nucleotide-binding universal stress UspA family protein